MVNVKSHFRVTILQTFEGLLWHDNVVLNEINGFTIKRELQQLQ